ncbi:GNAT family N-acetyltransferase [Paenibacillus xanthanilyticus]|uniref:GNAT family N-acetyltransferase n=1 Tax=Paenibacillus xanthanilyticus TaxID=1783531 RepID=A0ABV8JXV6_9BACL
MRNGCEEKVNMRVRQEWRGVRTLNFIQLEGNRVSLIPLETEHAEALYACAASPLIWENLPVNIRQFDDMLAFIRTAIAGRERGEEFPYAVYDKSLNRMVGMTRYLRISDNHKNLNIGWTWYDPVVWRTAVNTECKYMLLQYAFETWGALRVELITTTAHTRSQNAIERLGAQREGILRKKYNGRDYVVYSIIDEDWADVKARLAARLRGESS